MKIGWCADLREAGLLHGLGFDFIELPLAAFDLENRATIDTAKAAVAAAPLPTPAFNKFFPSDMDEENEPLETLRDCAPWLAHIHLADTGRRNPGSGSYDYERFMGLLKEIGYTGAISSECKLENPEPEMRQSLAFLRRYCIDSPRRPAL